MDNTASRTRRQDVDTSQAPSPPNVISKSTAEKALSAAKEGFDTGASPEATSRRSGPRSTDNQTTGHSAAASRGRQATTEQVDVELDARSRAGKVSTFMNFRS